jgi:hypothetical protein
MYRAGDGRKPQEVVFFTDSELASSTDPAPMKAVAGQRSLRATWRYRFVIELPSLGKAG